MTVRHDPSRDPAAIEQELMAAVHRTRSEHDAAKAQYDMLMNVRRDLGLAHPDGIAALRKAMHIYDDARRRHEAALMALSEFVLGK